MLVSFVRFGDDSATIKGNGEAEEEMAEIDIPEKPEETWTAEMTGSLYTDSGQPKTKLKFGRFSAWA